MLREIKYIIIIPLFKNSPSTLVISYSTYEPLSGPLPYSD